jgi:hypothetical protein
MGFGFTNKLLQLAAIQQGNKAAKYLSYATDS